MIHVTIMSDGFVIEGHADYAEHGQDIVCASVSSLSQFISILLEKNVPSVETSKGTGYLKVKANLLYPVTRMVLSEFSRFISDVAKHYPKNIKVTYK